MDESSVLIIGANGQLGRALQVQYPNARKVDITELDITNAKAVEHYNWDGVSIILNAAAYTNVDGAETTDGRVAAWQANAMAPGNLVQIALKQDITLVHISTDYVFDGQKNEYSENDSFSPLGVYGASKAAGDIVVGLLPKHYITRVSWVIGDGKNFVRTILELGKKGVNPTVIADDIGRPTFTSELVRAINHLLTEHVPYGTYNVSNEGKPVSWSNLTREIFKQANFNLVVTDITDAEYYSNKPEAATRPHNSVFNLDKLHNTNFQSRDWNDDLADYIKKELSK